MKKTLDTEDFQGRRYNHVTLKLSIGDKIRLALPRWCAFSHMRRTPGLEAHVFAPLAKGDVFDATARAKKELAVLLRKMAGELDGK